jgi:hypothetical protein
VVTNVSLDYLNLLSGTSNEVLLWLKDKDRNHLPVATDSAR